ncbi:MAG: hypothetical protein AB7N76_16150 [Planctomycetota bacterium]
MAEALRPEVARVRADATVSTKIATRDVHTSPRVYRHLLTHLPQAARWLKALELGRYDIEDRPEGRFHIDDGSGAVATGERALDEPAELCVVARGKLEVTLLPRILGTGVIRIRYPQVQPEAKPGEPKPAPALRCEAEVWFRVDSQLLHGLSRPFRRVLAGVLRDKLDALVRAATALAEQIDKDPLAVLRRLSAAKLPEEDQAAFRRAFLVF